MGICITCGNEYDRTFTVTWNGTTGEFDSIECAAAVIAPHCAHCGCRILGHGVQAHDAVYCCAHCARKAGVVTLLDRHPATVE